MSEDKKNKKPNLIPEYREDGYAGKSSALPAPPSNATGPFGADPNAIPASVLADPNYVKKGYSGNANAPVAPVSVPQGSFGPDPNMPVPSSAPANPQTPSTTPPATTESNGD